MHPSAYIDQFTEKPAYVMAGSGESVTYRELSERANQGAHFLRGIGLATGDVVALFFDNHPRFFEWVWAAHSAGLYYVCISNRLTAAEAAYIVKDSGAKALIISATASRQTPELATMLGDLPRFAVGGDVAGYGSADAARASMSTAPIGDQRQGVDFLYSSGTTGRPKGVRTRLPASADILQGHPFTERARDLYGMGPDTVYLSPAPLYHAAPLRWAMSVLRLGGTVIVMEKFDAREALSLIERFKVTHAQWVPTHFVRMLKLPESERNAYNIETLKVAFHSAAPCPVAIKEAMIDWWGPILTEFYSGTEGIGTCAISADEWLERKGSVGRPILGELRICDSEGNVQQSGSLGHVYFANGPSFEYHNDPAKTAGASNRYGWLTYGDMGYTDEEGYLYLCDRSDFMIISGGVNIYPAEIEGRLVEFPGVADAAVIGIPDEDLGMRPLALVELASGVERHPELAGEIMAFLSQTLSRIKMPVRIEFRDRLPREPNGKLMKKQLQTEYAADASGEMSAN